MVRPAATMAVVPNTADSDVLSRMEAAEQVLRSAGVEVEPCPDTAEELLRRAVRWQRYARGPAPQPLRGCAFDVARGTLRLWAATGGLPAAMPAVVASRRQVQLARVALSAEARMRCARLRARLGQEAALLSLHSIAEFDGRLRTEVSRAAAELDNAVSRRIAALGLPVESVGWNVDDVVPVRRSSRLENRLTAVLGVGFGAGVAVTVGRFSAAVWPDRAVVAGIGSALLGLVLMGWVVGARRLLIERAAAERWAAETTTNLRTAFDERVLSRMLAAEAAARTGSGGDTPN